MGKGGKGKGGKGKGKRPPLCSEHAFKCCCFPAAVVGDRSVLVRSSWGHLGVKLA